jgi:Flp pilus assembly protein CpaB
MKRNIKKPRKIHSFSRSAMLPWYLLGIVLLLFILFVGVRLQVDSSQAVASVQNEVVMVSLDVPSRQVKKGEALNQVPFTTIQWPGSSAAGKFIVSKESYKDFYAATILPAFSPVSISSISQTPLDINVVAGGIPSGYRAITVKVDVESAVEGWAQTGNFVDVILMKQSKDPELGIEAKVIAENVKILSAGASAEIPGGGVKNTQAPPTVTLLVSQEDALKVRTAATIGKLTFALRGIGDESPTLAVHMSQKNLLGGSRSLTLDKVKERIKGKAKGPDGSIYILDSNSEWIEERSTSSEKGAIEE